MKNLLTGILLLVAASSFAGKNFVADNVGKHVKSYIAIATPPSAVLAAFHSRFPQATRVVWTKEDFSRWEADFFIGKQEWRVVYKANGTLLLAQKTA